MKRTLLMSAGFVLFIAACQSRQSVNGVALEQPKEVRLAAPVVTAQGQMASAPVIRRKPVNQAGSNQGDQNNIRQTDGDWIKIKLYDPCKEKPCDQKP